MDRTYKYKYKSADVVKWANYYSRHRITIQGLEDRYGVSHSTIWWSFVNRLPMLDVSLYDMVMETADYNYRNKPVIKRQ